MFKLLAIVITVTLEKLYFFLVTKEIILIFLNQN